MPKYTIQLELEEVYTCEYEVEADSEEEAEAEISKLERMYGVSAEETNIFDWDYYGTNFAINPYGNPTVTE